MNIDNGLVRVSSHHGAAETIARLESIVLRKGLSIVVRIDHSADAAKAGMKLRPTYLLIFGSPKAGTPLMVASPTAALDLPLKVLAWEDDDGICWLCYSSPTYVADRHNIPLELVANIAGIEAICAEAGSAGREM
jgi:uncharacterized protein (DUF302 family)